MARAGHYLVDTCFYASIEYHIHIDRYILQFNRIIYIMYICAIVYVIIYTIIYRYINYILYVYIYI